MTSSTIRLSTGEVATVRTARPEDAVKLTEHFRACAGESDYLSFGVGEYDRPVDVERARILASMQSSNRCYVVCCVDDKIVASLVVTASSRPRRRHIGEFGIVVGRDYWGRGIGSQLLDILMRWARSSTLTKLGLKVREDNARAIHMYKKLGFLHEATLKAEIFDGIRYHDIHYMSIMLTEASDSQQAASRPNSDTAHDDFID